MSGHNSLKLCGPKLKRGRRETWKDNGSEKYNLPEPEISETVKQRDRRGDEAR